MNVRFTFMTLSQFFHSKNVVTGSQFPDKHWKRENNRKFVETVAELVCLIVLWEAAVHTTHIAQLRHKYNKRINSLLAEGIHSCFQKCKVIKIHHDFPVL